MDELRIRVATPADIPFLRQMQWQALLASPRFLTAMGLETVRQTEDHYWAAWPSPDEIAFVAEDAQRRLLGAVILRVHERHGQRVAGYRLAIGVEEDMRGRGIGQRLIERARRHTQDIGADYLLLFVDTSNERAIRTYRATGFELGDQHGVVPMIARHKKAQSY